MIFTSSKLETKSIFYEKVNAYGCGHLAARAKNNCTERL